MFKRRRKVYKYKVVPLGITFEAISRNIGRKRGEGWTLVSTYLDKNRNTVGQEPTVCGVFQTWEKR